MTAMEIALLVLGAVIFVASFVIPEMRADGGDAEVSKGELQQMLKKEEKYAREQIQNTVDEEVSRAAEHSEQELKKILNEKIMAINEYSDTVLEEIAKNHKEALFFYDMLHDKEVELKNTIRKAEQTKREAIQQPEKKEAPEIMPETILQQTDLFPETTEKQPEAAEEVDLNFGLTADGGRNQNDQILAMKKQGKSNVAIAKELGLGVGEVKLVLDLFEGVNG